MKKLCLLLVLSMLPMLALAQTDSASPSSACSSGSGLFFNPPTWNFPTIARHFSEEKQFVLCNDRSNNVTITSIATSPSPLFAVLAVGTNCPGSGTLPSNSQCTITVEFDPVAAGNHLGTLTVECTGAPACPISVPLSGTAEDDATLTPRSFNFGSWPKGTTSPAEPFTLTNNEPIPLNIISISTDPSAIFPVEGGSDKCKTTQPVPAGGSCYINVAFSPDEVGQASGYLQVLTDSRDGTPPNVTLSGTGICLPTECCPPEGCCPPPCCPPSGKASGDICPPHGALTPLPGEPLSAYLHPALEAILNN